MENIFEYLRKRIAHHGHFDIGYYSIATLYTPHIKLGGP